MLRGRLYCQNHAYEVMPFLYFKFLFYTRRMFLGCRLKEITPLWQGRKMSNNAIIKTIKQNLLRSGDGPSGSPP